MTERNLAQVKAKESNLAEDYNAYKNLRNDVCHLVKKDKKNWLKTKLDNKEVTEKEVWRTTKQFIGQTGSGPPTCIRIGNNITSKPIKIANALNEYFIEKVKKLRESLPQPTYDPIEVLKKIQPMVTSEFKIVSATDDDILKIIKEANNSNSTGQDKISMNFIKAGKEVLVPILTKLVNLSIKTNTMPEILKRSRITPLAKPKKSRENKENYRPINNISVVAKITEKFIFKQLQTYMENNNLINKEHHGGRKDHSTTTAVLQLENIFTEELDQNNLVGLILIDLSAAYDMVDHFLLIKKLKHLGVHENSLKWFISYLKNRTQLVEIETVRSNNINMPDCSVVQGGVGAGILYNIYTNDMTQVADYKITTNKNVTEVTHDKITKVTVNFVDDSTTITVDKDPIRLNNKLQTIFERLYHYLTNNNLFVNPDKTKLLVMTKEHLKYMRQRVSFWANEFHIKPSFNAKLLGMYLSSVPNYKYELLSGPEAKLKRINQRIGSLKRISEYCNVQTRLKIANAIIVSVISYMAPVWGSSPQYILDKIQTSQLKAARTVIGHRCFKWSREKILKNLNWMSIEQTINYQSSLLIHKTQTQNVPLSMSNNLKTRSLDELRLRSSQTTDLTTISNNVPTSAIASTNFIRRQTKEYNSIPQNIKEIRDMDQFKKIIKQHYLNRPDKGRGQHYDEL
jgi:hypothetical protein